MEQGEAPLCLFEARGPEYLNPLRVPATAGNGWGPKALTAAGNHTLFRDNWQLVKQLLFKTLLLPTLQDSCVEKGAGRGF